MAVMKRLALAVTALTLVAVPAAAPSVEAATSPVVGRIADVYARYGGSAKVGSPIGSERKVTISYVNGYSQRFASRAIAGGVSTVLWNRKDPRGGWATTASSPDPKLSRVYNERDPLARMGFKQGLVYRSSQIHGATLSDKLNMSGLLRGGVIIDLRGDGTRDPNLPGVTEVRYPMTGTATVTTFVTKATDRASLGRTLKMVAATVSAGRPVLIHCHYGKDRTGWTFAVLESLLGASDPSIRADYLRSPDVDESRLLAGFAAVAANYPDTSLHGATHPGMYRYATEGLGLTPQEITNLRLALG